MRFAMAEGAPEDTHGFWESLFDFSFTSFITLKVVRVAYVLNVLVVALLTLAGLVDVLKTESLGGGGKVLLCIAVVVLGFCFLIAVRCLLEFVANLYYIGVERRGRPPEEGMRSTAPPPRAGGLTAKALHFMGVDIVEEESVPAGWYVRPNNPEEERYWDGGAWTKNVRPRQAA